MLTIGRLNSRITLLKQAEGEGEFGETTQQWKPWRTVYATVRPIRAYERKDGNQRIEDEAEYRITVRYKPYGDRIDADMKIQCKIRGKIRTLDILGDPIDKDGLGEFMEMQAKEHRITKEEDLWYEDGVSRE